MFEQAEPKPILSIGSTGNDFGRGWVRVLLYRYVPQTKKRNNFNCRVDVIYAMTTYRQLGRFRFKTVCLKTNKTVFETLMAQPFAFDALIKQLKVFMLQSFKLKKSK